jgi:hypothetical protein
MDVKGALTVIIVLAGATECSSHVALDLPKSTPAAESG